MRCGLRGDECHLLLASVEQASAVIITSKRRTSKRSHVEKKCETQHWQFYIYLSINHVQTSSQREPQKVTESTLKRPVSAAWKHPVSTSISFRSIWSPATYELALDFLLTFQPLRLALRMFAERAEQG